MFEDFGPKKGRTEGQRFGLSLLASGLVYVTIGGGLVAASAAARQAIQEEELVQIEFSLPPEPVAVPEPPAPPPKVAQPAASPRPKVERQALRTPDEIPKEKPAESDAALAEAPAAGSGQDGFLDGVAGGTGMAPVKEAVAPPPPPPPPPAPKAAGPVHLPESATAPVAKSGNVAPEYPEAARKSGTQAVVVAKVVIAADGRVTSVEIMRGPDLFHESVKRALMAWRYEPARLPDGTAISVFRIIQLPFKLENM